MINDFQELIAQGLRQPEREPVFFVYPTGYDLAVTFTAYNTTEYSNQRTVIIDAKLEPNT